MSETAKENYAFERFLAAAAAITVITGWYESYAQQFHPSQSILALLHSYGYLKEYAVAFGPGKGIWRMLAWAGSFMMVVMMLYSLRKRFTTFHSLGSIRHWLSAHMFLGIMGPTLITFHTTFKFGGLVATCYWSMMLTMLFGILGRYIYVQIPRSLAGTELEAGDIDNIIKGIDSRLGKFSSEINISNLIDSADEKIDEGNAIKALFAMMKTDISNLMKIIRLDWTLSRRYRMPWKARRNILSYARKKAALIRKKNYLVTSRNLLHYWHVVHIPLAIVMFIIMFLHIIVYYLFRPATGTIL